MAVDALSELSTLLSDNWTSANTDSKTPNFVKITDQKRIDFMDNQDFVIFHRPLLPVKAAGISAQARRDTAIIDVDIRVSGLDQESHSLNVVEEVERILDANLNSGTTNFDVIDPNWERRDLSDGGRGIWRFMLSGVKLIKLVKSRT